MTRPILVCRELVKELGADVKTTILHGVNLTINEGEFVALTGPSGSGKSTLLYVLGVLDKPTAGNVALDGQDVSVLSDDERAKIRREKLGFVFQFHFLLPEFTVLENVELPMMRRGNRTASEIHKRASETLERLGLGPLLGRKPHQLSGGQQQRVSIARAVANGPRVLLADEPTGNLDSASGETVIGIFEQLAKEMGMTIVMVTHESAFASRAHREVRMKDGRILENVRSVRPGPPPLPNSAAHFYKRPASVVL